MKNPDTAVQEMELMSVIITESSKKEPWATLNLKQLTPQSRDIPNIHIHFSQTPLDYLSIIAAIVSVRVHMTVTGPSQALGLSKYFDM